MASFQGLSYSSGCGPEMISDIGSASRRSLPQSVIPAPRANSAAAVRAEYRVRQVRTHRLPDAARELNGALGAGARLHLPGPGIARFDSVRGELQQLRREHAGARRCRDEIVFGPLDPL